MNEYAFDVTLLAALRIKATSEAEARKLLREALDCATINCGNVNGEPLVGEASLDVEGDMELYEINGNDADFDPENIYGLPGIRQSIEEDRK